ncbi:hypothetical protein SCUCBS95973_001810 [Sporothrix curviconia]|uniref:Beta-glucuronidase C-terminal domain-containing protein n=1 Tax=Sporothrix curviconia TaxID=1260050 RepID=A0ABP0B1U0_9PEZI
MRIDRLAARAATTVSIPATVPQGAFTVNPSFPGVSFELSTFSLYAQTSPTDASANQYSINLISEVAKRTGGRPLIRVGGDTGDSVAWDATQTAPIVPAPGTTATGTLTIGPQFWPLTQLLSPANVLWMPQISYLDTKYTDANEAAQSIMSGIGTANLGAIEIGNEPNLYSGGDPTAATAQDFADRFQAIAANITEAAAIPRCVSFAGPDIGSEVTAAWSMQDIFESSTFDATGNIGYATDHWYRCVGGPCTIPDLMSHANMVADTAKHIAPVAAFFSTYKDPQGRAVPYYLDEINIQTGGTANQTVAFSFGTALYGTDFMLYLMSLGVSAVNWEQVYSSLQNVWQPSTSATMAGQTKNIYYALITAAEFIGTSGSTKVVEVAPGGGNDGTTFSSYVAYDNDAPARVALVNLNYWDTSLGTSRPNPVVAVEGIPSSVSSVTVKYLTNPGGAAQDADDTTFGGSQWTFASLGAEVENVQSTTVVVPVSGGVAQVPIPYSAVAIVYL